MGGLSAQEAQWLQHEYEAVMEEARDKCESQITSRSDVVDEENAYVARLLADHPTVTQEEARWLFARERQQGMCDTG